MTTRTTQWIMPDDSLDVSRRKAMENMMAVYTENHRELVDYFVHRGAASATMPHRVRAFALFALAVCSLMGAEEPTS